jgi:hypothetical protein
MRPTALVLLVGSLVAGPAHAGESLQTLKEGSWVCSTPEAYDTAITRERGEAGDLEALKQHLLEQKLCIYVDAGFVEKIMVPFATIVERQGRMVKVTFTVQFRKRIELLHRQISRVTLVGWTDAQNLLDKEIL